MTLSGLEPLTNARRSVFQLELQGFLADHVETPMTGLPDQLRTKLEGYGIDAATWDRMRAVPLHPLGLLRPADLAEGSKVQLANPLPQPEAGRQTASR